MDHGSLKAELRRQTLGRRDALSDEERIEASLKIHEIGAAEIDTGRGEIVSGFWPIRSEVDVRPLMAALRDKGARLCLPVTLGRTTIVFRELIRGAEMVETGYGTMGPGPAAETLDPTTMLVPLAAFDNTGHRIGYGAGHYDRAISNLHNRGSNPRLIGVAFSTQQVDAVPYQAHDVALSAVLTEEGLHSMPANGT